MKFLLSNKSLAALLLAGSIGCLPIQTQAQAKHASSGTVKIVIEGTSNIHDWNMQSDKGSFTGTCDLNAAGQPTALSALSFSVPAQSLKSEHSQMDKNTYKALNATKYPSISFIAGAAAVRQESANAYSLVAKGQLTISGTTRDVQLTASGVQNADKSITYTGQYKLKMTDYKVEPPSIMFGTIKTGDDIVVKYTLVLKTI